MPKTPKKKNRRPQHSSTPRMYGDGTPSQGSTQPVQGGVGSPTVDPSPADASRQRGAGRATAPAKPAIPFREQYAYVVGDLRRLGIFAAVTFAVMIAAGLIVNR